LDAKLTCTAVPFARAVAVAFFGGEFC
jgi:hypothetical protein